MIPTVQELAGVRALISTCVTLEYICGLGNRVLLVFTLLPYPPHMKEVILKSNK